MAHGADIRGGYLLIEAFELAGKHLFGRAWRGDEWGAWNGAKPPAELAAARAPYEAEAATVEAEIARLREAIRWAVKDAEIPSMKAELQARMQRAGALATELYGLPAADEDAQRRYAMLERKRMTLRTLIDALAGGQLVAHTRSDIVLPRQAWSGERGWKPMIDLSVIRVPQTYSNLRRHLALIERIAFERWLATLVPAEGAAAEDLTPEEACRRWLRQLADGPKAKPKPEYKADALKLFPSLGGRGFERAWESAAPPAWQRPGRHRRQP